MHHPHSARARALAPLLAALFPAAACDPEPDADDEAPVPIEVHEGESIQAALDVALPGQPIRVHPGTYYEGLSVGYDDAVLEGVVEGDSRPVLDGEMQRDNGVFGTSNGFRISGFAVRNYVQNGVWITSSDDVVFHDMVAESTGRYGLYAAECTNVVVEDSLVTQSADAGVYIGQGEIALVRNVEVHSSVIGVECENTVDCVVEGNYLHGNAAGVANLLLLGLVRKDNVGTVITGNVIEDNNIANFANPNDLVSEVPSGTGVMVVGPDETWVYDNVITGNDSFGIAVYGMYVIYTPEEFSADPLVDAFSDHNRFEDNQVSGNGSNPDPLLTDLGVPGADLIWDGTGEGNCWTGHGDATVWSAAGFLTECD